MPEKGAMPDLVLARKRSVSIRVPASVQAQNSQPSSSSDIAYNVRINVGVKVNDRNWAVYFMQALQDG